MFPNHHAPSMPPPQPRSVQPETFLLDHDAQQSLPQDSVVALQQVDNRKLTPLRRRGSARPPAAAWANRHTVKYFLISAPVDWRQEQCCRRFLLPTGEYVSCVLWCVCCLHWPARRRALHTDFCQEQSLPHLRYRHRTVPLLSLPGFRSPGEKLEEIRRRHLL